MTSYKNMKDTFQEEYKQRSALYKDRLSRWSEEPPIVMLEKPTNIARARELGYKAKQGINVVRVRVSGGASKRKTHGGGRKPSKSGMYFTREKSAQAIAEERAARKYSNYEILNSYFIGRAGSVLYYEVIMLNRESPVLKSDPIYSKILDQKGRAFRGLTSAGRRHRGIMKKSYGSIPYRPSKNALMRRKAARKMQ
ncbi:MAG: 50S ribosomal protein L15e [Candidatus Micrarchaeia archaeon]